MPRLNPFRRRQPSHRFSSHQIAVPVVEDSVRLMALRLDDWQAKVLRYAEIVPELITAYAFVHNAMDRVTFEIQHYDRGTNEWRSDDTPAMQGIERRINNAFRPGRAAALLHLVGEAYILVRRCDGNVIEFETLGPTEIREKQKGHAEKRILKDGEKDDWVPVGSDVTIVRVWTPDPKDRHRALSAYKALLGLLETMAIELLRDQADAIGVLAGNGLLLIPTEILPDEGDTLDASDTPGTRVSFEHQLEEAMLSTITDRSKGEAVVPVVLYGPAEFLPAVRHVTLQRSETAAETSARMDAYISRLAGSIELPRQIITGTGDGNHWSDWLVDPNTWAYSLEPLGQRLADSLYKGLVRGIICNLHLDPDDYRLVPNAAQAIAKQDISSTAVEVYKTGALQPEALIEATGFDPSDMRPDAEEALLALLLSQPEDAAYLQAPPDRAAASSNPRTILRQAGRVANAQQSRLQKIYARILNRIADDAARDGRAAQKDADKTAAAKDILFLGYNPGVYFARFAEEILDATADELFAYLRRIATLTGRDYQDLRREWFTEFKQRAEAVTKEAEGMAEQISRASFGKGKPVRITDNATRALSSTASGGSNQVDGGAGNTQRPTHAGQDPAMKSALTDAVGAYATEYTWVVGHPNKPFPPHQALAGHTWFSWEEFDKLDSELTNKWLPGAVYFPGDHDGCQCDYSIDFVPVPATEGPR